MVTFQSSSLHLLKTFRKKLMFEETLDDVPKQHRQNIAILQKFFPLLAEGEIKT